MVGPFRLYQFLLMVFAVIFILFMYNRLRYKKTTPASFVLSILVWIVILFFAFKPKISDPLAGLFGIGRGVDLLLIIGLALSLYVGMRLFIRLDDMNQELDNLVREIAINNEIELDDEE